MSGWHHAVLSRIKTVSDMVEAFRDEERCRQLLEQMVWRRGRICPVCGFRESIALAGRDTGAKARPGLYQCSNGSCRHQFWHWLRKKHRTAGAHDLLRDFGPSSRRSTRRLWRDGPREQFILAWTPVRRFQLGWMKQPDFA